MRIFLYKLFVADDKTKGWSSSKLVRMLTFILAGLYVTTGLTFIYLPSINITEMDFKMFDRIGEFLIFLVPAIEASYQTNRWGKMKHRILNQTNEDKPEITRNEI